MFPRLSNSVRATSSAVRRSYHEPSIDDPIYNSHDPAPSPPPRASSTSPSPSPPSSCATRSPSPSPLHFPDFPCSRRFSYAPFAHELLDLNTEQKLSKQEVDAAVEGVLRAKWKVGLEGVGTNEGVEAERKRLGEESEKFWKVRNEG